MEPDKADKPQIVALKNEFNHRQRPKTSITIITGLDKKGILEYSLHHIRMVIFANILCLFSYSGRTSIWISYVTETDTFSFDGDKSKIAFVVWIEYIIISLFGFIFCIFGQIVGYDKSMTLLTLIILAGCIIECVANNFVILTIGYLIAQLSFLMIYITISYISWCLPFESAIIYISYNYAIIILFSLSGSLCSSFIAYYCSYKMTFIVNTILMFIAHILTLNSIFKKQKNLQVEQFQIEKLYGRHHQYGSPRKKASLSSKSSPIPLKSPSKSPKNSLDGIRKHHRFPIFLQEIVKRFNDEDVNQKLFHLNIPVKFERYFLFHYIIQIGFLYGSTSTFYMYYTQYIMERYTGESYTQFVAGLHLFCSAIGGVWGILFARYIASRLSFKLERMFILFGLCIKFAIFEFAFTENTQLYLNFIWCSLSMFIAGSLLIVFEKLLLEIQTFPKETGKINGIKCIVTNVLKAICVLAPGILWETSIESLFYSLAAMIAIMVLLEMVYTILINGTLKHQMRLRKNKKKEEELGNIHEKEKLKANANSSEIAPPDVEESQFQLNPPQIQIAVNLKRSYDGRIEACNKIQEYLKPHSI